MDRDGYDDLDSCLMIIQGKKKFPSSLSSSVLAQDSSCVSDSAQILDVSQGSLSRGHSTGNSISSNSSSLSMFDVPQLQEFEVDGDLVVIDNYLIDLSLPSLGSGAHGHVYLGYCFLEQSSSCEERGSDGAQCYFSSQTVVDSKVTSGGHASPFGKIIQSRSEKMTSSELSLRAQKIMKCYKSRFYSDKCGNITNLHSEDSTICPSCIDSAREFQQVAIKITEKPKVVASKKAIQMQCELKSLKLLKKHPNIVQFIDLIETSNELLLITEFISGGELLRKIKKSPSSRISESQMRSYFRDILSGVAFCHDNFIAHRDIKPENILIHKNSKFPPANNHPQDPNLSVPSKPGFFYKCSSFFRRKRECSSPKGNDSSIEDFSSLDFPPNREVCKLIDFGFSSQLKPHLKTRMHCGSTHYVAPEVIETCHQNSGFGAYYHGLAADMWSLGVLLYVCLVGKFPYSGKTMKEVYCNIQNCPIRFPKYLSKTAKDLLRRLLTVDSSIRATIDMVNHHPWVNMGYSYPCVTRLPKIMNFSDSLLKNNGINQYIFKELKEMGFKNLSLHKLPFILRNPTDSVSIMYALIHKHYISNSFCL